MLLYLLLTSIFLLGSPEIYIEKPFQSGSIETTNGTIEGEIKIDLESNTVVVKQGNDYSLFTARQINEVRFQGMIFVGKSFNGDYYLFEILHRGNKTLLFREGLIYKYEEGTPKLPYFFIENEGIKPIVKIRELLGVFGEDEKWMVVFIKSNKLDLELKSDLLIALKYHQKEKI